MTLPLIAHAHTQLQQHPCWWLGGPPQKLRAPHAGDIQRAVGETASTSEADGSGLLSERVRSMATAVKPKLQVKAVVRPEFGSIFSHPTRNGPMFGIGGFEPPQPISDDLP